MGIFYYPWYGNGAAGASYEHWASYGRTPPLDIASSFYPARGLYSSSDEAVVAAQMEEIASAGIREVIVSWWGRGSAEDARLPLVVRAARVRGLSVAAHLEPYEGRSAATVAADAAYLRGFGILRFFVYEPFGIPEAEWASVLGGPTGLTFLAHTTLVGRAAAARFHGVYTYDVLAFGPESFARLCNQARVARLACAPSVGPGYDARRATGDARVKPRRRGRTYDAMWKAAIAARPDSVTITSYNEWLEGTQIEPAAPAPAGGPAAGERVYESYDRAYGLSGADANVAYLERTAYWTRHFEPPPGCPARLRWETRNLP